MWLIIEIMLVIPKWIVLVIAPIILFVIVLKTSKNFKHTAWYIFGYLCVAFFFYCTDLIAYTTRNDMSKFYDEIYATEPKCFAEIFEKRIRRVIENKTIGGIFIKHEMAGKAFRDYILADVKKNYRLAYGDKGFEKCANQKPKARGSKSLKGK